MGMGPGRRRAEDLLFDGFWQILEGALAYGEVARSNESYGEGTCTCKLWLPMNIMGLGNSLFFCHSAFFGTLSVHIVSPTCTSCIEMSGLQKASDS